MDREAPTGGPLTSGSTLRTAAERWRQGLDDLDLRPGTVERYEGALDKHVLPLLGHRLLREITPAEVARFLKKVDANHRMVRVVLGHVMRSAVWEGALSTNPVDQAPPASRSRAASRPRSPRALRQHEILAVREAVAAWEQSSGREKSIPLADLVLVQLATGLRISELLALTPADLNIPSGTLHIRATLTMPRGGIQRTPVKTSAGNRVIRVPRLALSVLSARAQHAETRESPLFASSRGTWLWPHNVRRAWREARALSDTDLSFVHPHLLRKTAGSQIVESHGLLAASKLLGHASVAITEAAYYDRHARVDDVTDALDGLLTAWDAPRA